MANRTLPFTNHASSDIINMFALDMALANEHLGDSGAGDIGVFVTVSNGDFTGPAVDYMENAYMGKVDYPNMRNKKRYLANTKLTFKPAKKGDKLLGMTLIQTAKYDNLGNNLLDKPDTLVQNFAVIPGTSVKILQRGWVQVTVKAFDVADETAPGIVTNDYVALADTDAKAGKLVKWVSDEASGEKIGVVRATGKTDNDAAVPYFVVEIY